MDRHKLGVRRFRETGFPYKRDTPVKPVQRRRGGYRIRLPKKRYYTLAEEPEEDNMHGSGVKPATSESETPILQDFQDGDSQQSCSTEPDTSLSSEEEDEDYDSSNFFSCGSTTLSSLPSPEIFRTENVKFINSAGKEELSLCNLHNKNSTLLDVSYAKSIQMQQPPNISAIIDTSTVVIEKNCVTSHHKTSDPDNEIQTDSFKSENLQNKTPPKLTVRKPIVYKKKVWFKSPTIAETFDAEPIPSSTSNLSNILKEVKPDANPSIMGDIDCKEETLPLTVKLKRPVKTSPVKARFFDFGSDSVEDAYFQWMRERCDKLKNAVLFPFMQGTHKPSDL